MRTSISVEVYPVDILNELDEDDIIDYVKENGLLSKSDFDDEDCVSSDVKDESELVLLIERFMSRGLPKVIPRTKTELKEYVCEIIEYWRKLK